MSHKVELIIYLNTDDESLKIANRWRAADITRKIIDVVENVYVVDKIVVRDAPQFITTPSGWDKVEAGAEQDDKLELLATKVPQGCVNVMHNFINCMEANYHEGLKREEWCEYCKETF